MRTRKTAQERKLDIIQAAIALFNDKGYDKTTVDDIAESAGIAKGSFYLHFKSKQEVLDAGIDHIADGLLAAFSACLTDTALSPGERLCAYLELNFALSRRHGDSAFAAQLHAPAFENYHDRVMSCSVRKMMPIFTDLIDAGVKTDGFVAEDAGTSAAALLGALRQMHESLGPRTDLTMDKKRELTYAMLSRLLGADLQKGGKG